MNKESESASGGVATRINLSSGVYRILSAAVFSPQAYAEEVHIGFDQSKGAEGEYLYVKLGSGYMKSVMPFCLSNARLVTGPGRIFCSATHLETHTHILQIEIEKVGVVP